MFYHSEKSVVYIVHDDHGLITAVFKHKSDAFIFVGRNLNNRWNIFTTTVTVPTRVDVNVPQDMPERAQVEGPDK